MTPVLSSGPLLSVAQAQGSIGMTTHRRGRRGYPPPPKTKVTVVGQNEIYNPENLIQPFLVYKVLGPRPPV